MGFTFLFSIVFTQLSSNPFQGHDPPAKNYCTNKHHAHRHDLLGIGSDYVNAR